MSCRFLLSPIFLSLLASTSSIFAQEQTVTFTQAQGCASSGWSCVYTAKDSFPGSVSELSIKSADKRVSSVVFSTAQNGVISANVTRSASTPTMPNSFTGVVTAGTSPTPGPSPAPSPSAKQNSFEINMPGGNSTDASIQAFATVTPLDANGHAIADASGKSIAFSLSKHQFNKKQYICGVWYPNKTIQISATPCSTAPPDGLKPSALSVTAAVINDKANQASFKLYKSPASSPLNKPILLSAEGNTHSVMAQVNQPNTKVAYTITYKDPKTGASFSAPFIFDFTQGTTEHVDFSLPEGAKYTLTNGNVLTAFKNVKEKTQLINSSTTTLSISVSDVILPANLHIPGWPNYMAMGSVTDFNNVPLLQKRSFTDTIFKYAGNDGAGDAGKDPYSLFNTQKSVIKTDHIAIALGAIYGHPVVPTMVVYTSNASGGDKAAAQADLDNLTTLTDHYGYLAMVAHFFETHPDPNFNSTYGSIVLNPDYLGEAHKDAMYDGVKPPVEQGLTHAFNYLAKKGVISANQAKQYIAEARKKRFANTFKGYNQSINWLVNEIAPHVSFGWSDNIWSGTDHYWVHQSYHNPALLTQHVNSEAKFLRHSGAYGNKDTSLNPTYIAFDKYERDTIDPGKSVLGPYFYNDNDWSVYMQFVGDISRHFNNKPVMLFQTPGAHMKTIQDTSSEPLGATAPDYILGNKGLQNGQSLAKALTPSFLTAMKKTTVDNSEDFPSVSGKPSTFDVYAAAQPTALTFDNYTNKTKHSIWGYGHIEDMLRDNVFAVLWGGGSTTSIAGPEDDGGYLNSLIGHYMKHGSYTSNMSGAYTLTKGTIDANYQVDFNPVITPVKSNELFSQSGSSSSAATKSVTKTLSFTQDSGAGKWYAQYTSTAPIPKGYSSVSLVDPSQLPANASHSIWSSGSSVSVGISATSAGKLPATLSNITVMLASGKSPAPAPKPGPKPGPHGDSGKFSFTPATLSHQGVKDNNATFKYRCTPVDSLGQYVPSATCTIKNTGNKLVATFKAGKDAVSKVILTAIPQGLPDNAYVPGLEQSAVESVSGL